MDEAVSFLNEVESKLIQPQRRDEWVWVADPSDHFTIKSAYYVMRKKMRDAIEETLSVHFEGAVGVAMVETENLKLLDAVEPLS